MLATQAGSCPNFEAEPCWRATVLLGSPVGHTLSARTLSHSQAARTCNRCTDCARKSSHLTQPQRPSAVFLRSLPTPGMAAADHAYVNLADLQAKVHIARQQPGWQVWVEARSLPLKHIGQKAAACCRRWAEMGLPEDHVKTSEKAMNYRKRHAAQPGPATHASEGHVTHVRKLQEHLRQNHAWHFPK